MSASALCRVQYKITLLPFPWQCNATKYLENVNPFADWNHSTARKCKEFVFPWFCWRPCKQRQIALFVLRSSVLPGEWMGLACFLYMECLLDTKRVSCGCLAGINLCLKLSFWRKHLKLLLLAGNIFNSTKCTINHLLYQLVWFMCIDKTNCIKKLGKWKCGLLH